jgi:hypothetical protein
MKMEGGGDWQHCVQNGRNEHEEKERGKKEGKEEKKMEKGERRGGAR